ncbi:cupin domain-containing protein [Piscinibacter sp. HJYY11]|uniref:cupin domain-containing protein n=1 Tax=Piscinibacter sp. HJYY11 TaxID=2801333 RepID=UPI0019201CEE|nr:cupin domain-containing protein [Piscinibacter sp. HJYY11]MBL0728225.1 DUF861 domain-containing protein [Piscinibacter sp. HJYY11]
MSESDCRGAAGPTYAQAERLDAAVFKGLDSIALKDDPIEPSWILEGQPHARSGCHSTNTDGWAATHVWECSGGRFRWHFGVEETVLILEGEVRVTDAKGRTQWLVPGTVAYFPTGTWWEWHIPQHVRKLSFNRRSVLPPARFLGRALGVLLRVFTRPTVPRLQPTIKETS